MGDERLTGGGLTGEGLVGRRDSEGVIRRGEKKLTVDRGELTVGGRCFFVRVAWKQPWRAMRRDGTSERFDCSVDPMIP